MALKGKSITLEMVVHNCQNWGTLPDLINALEKVLAEFSLNDATNKAFLHFEAEISAHFAAGGKYREWIYDYGSHVGSGFQNIGTRRTPVVRAVPSTDKIAISFVPDSRVVSGFRLETSFPYYPYPPPP